MRLANCFQSSLRIACLLLLCLVTSINHCAASQMESFYALPKEKFRRFCEIAHLIPEAKRPPVDENARFEIRIVSEEEQKTDAYKKVQAHYETVWNYLRVNGNQPARLKWSGYVLYELMEFLKETKKIDLMSNAVCESHGDFVWWVFDKDTKDKYLAALNPANFKEEALKKAFLAQAKLKHDALMVKMAERRDQLLKEGKLTTAEAKDFFQIEELMYKETNFPERGKSLMDSLKLIYRYLQMVDDNTVVILNIG